MAMTDAGLRDKLALQRTRLANERTLLAYVRTALSLIAGGVVILQFLAAQPIYVAIAWALLVSGFLSLAVGIIRFLYVRSHLKH